MRLIIDTNRYRDYCSGVDEVVRVLRSAERICMAFVTLAELRSGFMYGTRAMQNEKFLVQFLCSPRVNILLPDEETTHHYARIFCQLKKQGTPVPTNDIWLAALTVQHHMAIFSRDRHFEALPQIAIVHP